MLDGRPVLETRVGLEFAYDTYGVADVGPCTKHHVHECHDPLGTGRDLTIYALILLKLFTETGDKTPLTFI